jgi:LysM repeat protein
MQNIRIILLTAFITIGLIGRAQDEQTILNYIKTYKDLAIEEMQRTGVPASIKLAQGIHETTAGTSDLVIKSNNHFGIKCKSNWTGPSVSHDDDARGECFRKYTNSNDSYKDHSDFLKNSPRYASLFTLDPLDYTQWAYGLKKAGYATNPRYPVIIVKLIEDYHLNDYSLIALGKLAPGEEALAGIISETNGPVAIGTSVQSTPETILKDQGKQEVIPAVRITGVPATTKPPTQPATVVKEEKKPVVTETPGELPGYPSGEFKINETRVIYAKEGTSLLSIATQYNIALARLVEFNELKQMETLDKDQLIYLQRKRKTGAHEFHVVRSWDTLTDIAQEEGIRLDTLLEYNYLNGRSRPAVGEQLYLMAKAPAQPRLQ